MKTNARSSSKADSVSVTMASGLKECPRALAAPQVRAEFLIYAPGRFISDDESFGVAVGGCDVSYPKRIWLAPKE